MTGCDRHAALVLSWKLPPQLELGWAQVFAIKDAIRKSNTFSGVTPTILPGELLSFDLSKDPADQTLNTHIRVRQSPFSLT